VASDEGDEAQFQRRITAACVVENAQPEGRLGLYRRLVQKNLAGVARRLLPRTNDALAGLASDDFDAWFTRFLAEHGPRTSYLRDVPAEFVRWAATRWQRSTRVPAFVVDVARYEVDGFDVESSPRAKPPPLGEVSMRTPLVFRSPIRLSGYHHDVLADVVPIEPAQTFVLIWRDDDNVVHKSRIEARWAPLLGHLLDGVALGDAVAATYGAQAPTDTLADVAAFLAALGNTGALLGGRHL
jgi:uncharacterized protein